MPQELIYYIITEASDIIVDEEFKRILPVRSKSELEGLENSILKYGCIEPLILWENILLDGHNRLKILMEHGLPIKTVSLELRSREEALVWLIDFQITRRNLTPMQLSYYRGLHYHTEKKIISNAVGINQFSEVEEHNVPQPPKQSTAARLADHYNVSSMTIKRDAQVATAINTIGETSPETKTDILSGVTHITRKQLKELSSGTAEDVSTVIAEIQDGSFISRKPGGSNAVVSGFGTLNDGNSDDKQDTTDMQPWEIEFGKMTDEFRNELRSHAKTEDTASVRSAFRSYIVMLEELYDRI